MISNQRKQGFQVDDPWWMLASRAQGVLEKQKELLGVEARLAMKLGLPMVAAGLLAFTFLLFAWTFFMVSLVVLLQPMWGLAWSLVAVGGVNLLTGAALVIVAVKKVKAFQALWGGEALLPALMSPTEAD